MLTVRCARLRLVCLAQTFTRSPPPLSLLSLPSRPRRRCPPSVAAAPAPYASPQRYGAVARSLLPAQPLNHPVDAPQSGCDQLLSTSTLHPTYPS
jgi:hypothetical protein